MRKIIVRIPDENSQLATQSLEEPGAEVKERKIERTSGVEKSQAA